MMNYAYFTLKVIFILYHFFSWQFGHLEKTTQLETSGYFQNPWGHNLEKKAIATNLFPNMSRSKGNQAMKVGQLIEYNIRNMFVEKLYTKCGGETIPWSWCKKSKLSMSLDQLYKTLNSFFLWYATLRAIEIKWKQAADHLLLPNINLF